MTVRLFVRNLPYTVTEAELREFFSAAGQISYLTLPTDRETGKPRGFAFLEFIDAAQAAEAVRRFNNQLFKGRPLSVSQARPRDDRAPAKPVRRPQPPQYDSQPEPDVTLPAPDTKRSRDFGPDAIPLARRKGRSHTRSERVPKGPMREKVRGQFFGSDDDDDDLQNEEWLQNDVDPFKGEEEGEGEA